MIRGARWTLLVLGVGALIVSGCAKRPALSQAAAPPPTGAVTPPPAPATPPPPAPAPPPPQPPQPAAPPPAAERPQPKEFTAIPELKDIYFAFDRYNIRPADAKVLDANAKWLTEHPDQLVLIEGHCDERGTDEYNLALGERRARAARTYLVSKGIADNRISIISYGEERPVCTEHNEACWKRNRHDHFLVKPR